MTHVAKYACAACLLLLACIDPYDYQATEQGNYLVVEGAITTEEGPYVVKLTSTRNIINRENEFKLRMQNAIVSISILSSGRSVRLTEEDTSGTYYTPPSFRGELGEKYQLRVQLEDGREYLSDTVEILPAIDIDSLSFTYGSRQYVSDGKNIIGRPGFYFTSFMNDPKGIENSHLVKWEYTYKIFTHPENATAFDPETCNCFVPAPKDCCSICWIEENALEFSIINDRLVDGNPKADFDLFFLPIEGKMFYEKMHVVVKTSSLSKEAYLFWKTIYDSRYGQGGLFDPTPNTVRANVYRVDDRDELVLGYFYASEVKTSAIDILPTDLPVPMDTDSYFNDSCELLSNSTVDQPDYWND